MPVQRNPSAHHKGQRHRLPMTAVELRRLRYYVLFSDELSTEQICKRFGVGKDRILAIRKEHNEAAEVDPKDEGTDEFRFGHLY